MPGLKPPSLPTESFPHSSCLLQGSGSPSSRSVPWDGQEVTGGDSGAAFTAPGEASGFAGLLVDGLITQQMAVPL